MPVLDGTSGNDVLVGTDNDDTINGYGGIDRIRGNGGNDTISGGDGNDIIQGGDGEDFIEGDAGADFILGDAGNDEIHGGDDDDVIDGGDGNDILNGDNGIDRLFGRAGVDTISGGLGDDILVGGDGNDVLNGGDGADKIRAGNDDDTVDGGAGNDILLGQNGNDTIDGGDGDDYIAGGAGDDTIYGGDGADSINGGGGNDTLEGNAGDDIANGQGGDDRFTGGAGDDRFDGGGGLNDTAVYSGNRADYTLTYFPASGMVRVTDNRGGSPDGEDRLFRTEFLEFADTTIEVDGGAFTDVGGGGNTDVPGDQSTPVSLAVGNTYDGELEELGDTDWIRVELVAGQRYAISLDGSGATPLEDPLVRLYDANGNEVASNDDGGSGRNSLLKYTVPTSGTYYIEVDAWTDGALDYTGGYTVGLEVTDPLQEYSNDQIADFLREGYWVNNGGTARRFDAGEGDTITVNITALTEDGQTLARAALQLWSDVTGIIFQETGGLADIIFNDNEEGAYATTQYSNGVISRSNVNVSTDWIDTYGARFDGYSLQTYIHEIGHAIGLGHAGPYNGAADYGVDAAYLNDSWQATVMSYFSQNENTFINASYAFILTPMVADIVAMETMYGLSTNTRSGNTTYGYNSDAGGIYDSVTSFTRPVAYTVFDTGGTDTLDYSGAGISTQLFDLRQEQYSNLDGLTGNVGIARGTVIENAIGAAGDDTFIGNSADNVLTGNAGDDKFYSSGGDDVFDGGAGTDTAYFSGQESDYTISTNGSGNTVVTDNRAGSPDGATELIGVENIVYGTSASAAILLFKPDENNMDDLGGVDWDALIQPCSCSGCQGKLASLELLGTGVAPGDLSLPQTIGLVGVISGVLTLLDHQDFDQGEMADHAIVLDRLQVLIDAAASDTPSLAPLVSDKDTAPVMDLPDLTLGPDVLAEVTNDLQPIPDVTLNQDGELLDSLTQDAGLAVMMNRDGFLMLEEVQEISGEAMVGLDMGLFQILDANHVVSLTAAGGGGVPDYMIRVPEFDLAGFSVLSDNGETSLPAADVMRPLSEKGSDADIPAIADLQPDEAADLPFIADTPEGW